MNDISQAPGPTFFERAPVGCRQRAHYYWAGAGLLLLLVAEIGARVVAHGAFREVCQPLALGIVLAPFAVRLGFRALLRWKEVLVSFVPDTAAGTWFTDEIAPLRGTRAMLIFAIAFLGVALITFRQDGAFQGLPSLWWVYGYCVVTVAAVVGAVAAWSLLLVGRVVFRAGRFPVVVAPHCHGVTATGRMLCCCYGMAAVVWSVFALSGLSRYRVGNPALVYFALPVVLLFLGSFLWCQVPLHLRMVEWKSGESRRTNGELEAASRRFVAQPSQEGSLVVDHLRKRLDEIARLPEWPLDWRSFMGVGASAVVAAWPTVLEKLLR